MVNHIYNGLEKYKKTLYKNYIISLKNIIYQGKKSENTEKIGSFHSFCLYLAVMRFIF